jgi:hypothetical protein
VAARMMMVRVVLVSMGVDVTAAMLCPGLLPLVATVSNEPRGVWYG